jgi:O-methyltransferase involved in polyketide biosynthesis
MAETSRVRLGPVQHTLLITLTARARETVKKRPLLRDPKAVEMVKAIDFDTDMYGKGWGGSIVALRTSVFDAWVRAFLADHPDGTVVELGCGLNTRFERVDNGSVHWVDVDLPDVIDLRRQFFHDTDRRTSVAASVLDDDWQQIVADRPGPYFLVTEGVLVYLAEDDVVRALHGIATRFPGALVAFDTYSHRMLEQQHKMAARKDMPARWAWSCDDPRSLAGRIGMSVVESASVTRPPSAVRADLPLSYRLLFPMIDKLVQGFGGLTLFRA